MTSFPSAIEHGGAHGLRVFIAKLEDVADLNSFANLEGLAAGDVQVSLVDVADVGDARPGEVAAGHDIPEVIVHLVGAADHIFAVFESFIDDDECGAGIAFVCGKDFEADRAKVSGGAFEVESKLFGDHGAQLGHVSDSHQLGLIDEVVAAQKGNHGNLKRFCRFRLSSGPCRRRS